MSKRSTVLLSNGAAVRAALGFIDATQLVDIMAITVLTSGLSMTLAQYLATHFWLGITHLRTMFVHLVLEAIMSSMVSICVIMILWRTLKNPSTYVSGVSSLGLGAVWPRT